MSIVRHGFLSGIFRSLLPFEFVLAFLPFLLGSLVNGYPVRVALEPPSLLLGFTENVLHLISPLSGTVAFPSGIVTLVLNDTGVGEL